MSDKKHAEVVWTGGMQFLATADSGHGIVLDGAPEDGGRNTGTRPMELVLEALAGCTAMDVIFILRRKRQQVTDLRVAVTGERASSHPKVYEKIHIVYSVEGRQLSRKAVEDAVALSQEKYCSVSAMLQPQAEITYEVRTQNLEV